MPPHISRRDDDGYLKPFSYLHPGIGKSTFQDPPPHIFQQSVTLTASMWNENELNRNKDTRIFGNWGILEQYSPLIVGLFCGFGIVLIIMSTVMLWRYCLVSASKKVCCKGSYSATPQPTSLTPLRKEKFENQNGIDLTRTEPEIALKNHAGLQRSATIGSIPWNESCVGSEAKFLKLCGQSHSSKIPPNPQVHFEPLISQESLYTSHLYLHKLELSSSEMAKTLSKSTPALEDLYAKMPLDEYDGGSPGMACNNIIHSNFLTRLNSQNKVNFSKKRKNRMRKDDAAVIALSKSHSGQNNNSLAVYGSAIVVYNERTSL